MKRAVLMVILNATCGFFLKIFLIYSTIYDFSSFIKYLNRRNDPMYIYFMNAIFYFCSFEKTCHKIEHFATFLYLISLSIPLIFYRRFDRNFRAAFNDILKNFKGKICNSKT